MTPVSPMTRMPACRMACSSSPGVTNFSHRWVPRGSQRSTYSAPTMASAKLLSVRLRVAAIMSPPGLGVRGKKDPPGFHNVGPEEQKQAKVGAVSHHSQAKPHEKPSAAAGGAL